MCTFTSHIKPRINGVYPLQNGATDAKRKRFAEANGEDIKPKVADTSIAEQTMRDAQRMIEQRKKELNVRSTHHVRT